MEQENFQPQNIHDHTIHPQTYTQEETLQMPRLTVTQNKKKQSILQKKQSFHIDNQPHPNIQIDETVRLAAKGYRDSHNLELARRGSDVFQQSLHHERIKKKGFFFFCC